MCVPGVWGVLIAAFWFVFGTGILYFDLVRLLIALVYSMSSSKEGDNESLPYNHFGMNALPGLSNHFLSMADLNDLGAPYPERLESPLSQLHFPGTIECKGLS